MLADILGDIHSSTYDQECVTRQACLKSRTLTRLAPNFPGQLVNIVVNLHAWTFVQFANSQHLSNLNPQQEVLIQDSAGSALNLFDTTAKLLMQTLDTLEE